MDRDSFFDNLKREDTVRDELIRAQRQLGFEERCIKRVFSECGIKITGWGRFVNECRQETGHDKLTFQWFNNRFRGFPGQLCGKRIPRLHELQTLDLFKPVEKNRLVKAVARGVTKFCATNFVFMFPVTRTMFVAHDQEPDSVDGRVVWSAYGEQALFIEPSKHFFKAIGGDWYEG